MVHRGATGRNLREASAPADTVDRSASLVLQDRFSDFDHVRSTVRIEGEDKSQPFVTIAIPTFQRPDMLIETVRSALAQRFSRPFEIIVVDNDEASIVHRELLQALPELQKANFRYLVNEANIGMFENWNRCIQLARGEWVTILNDDDLLDADYLQLMFGLLDRRKSVDGLICRKRLLDERAQPHIFKPSPARRVAKWGLEELAYRWQSSRRIRPFRLFWEPILGNGAGFIFRKSAALRIGGYNPEEYPSSDWWFFVRFAKLYHLRQHRAVAASVRVAANDSAKLSTMKQGLASEYRLQQAMAGDVVPRWWRHLCPLTIERHRHNLEEYWKVEIPSAEIEQALDIRLAVDRPRLFKALRIGFGGF